MKATKGLLILGGLYSTIIGTMLHDRFKDVPEEVTGLEQILTPEETPKWDYSGYEIPTKGDVEKITLNGNNETKILSDGRLEVSGLVCYSIRPENRFKPTTEYKPGSTSVNKDYWTDCRDGKVYFTPLDLQVTPRACKVTK
jgi:hypothetical protein